MNTVYFTVYNGYYVSKINLKSGEIEYTLSEDDRLWFDVETANTIEKYLKRDWRIAYARHIDEEFPQMIKKLVEQGIISDVGCYKCYNSK